MKLTKPTKALLIGSAAYIVIWAAITKNITQPDFIQTALLYVGIAGLVGFVVDKIDGNKKWDFVTIGIVAAASSIIYNVAGMFMGEFTFEIGKVFMSALQQGIATCIVWAFIGGRK